MLERIKCEYIIAARRVDAAHLDTGTRYIFQPRYHDHPAEALVVVGGIAEDEQQTCVSYKREGVSSLLKVA